MFVKYQVFVGPIVVLFLDHSTAQFNKMENNRPLVSNHKPQTAERTTPDATNALTQTASCAQKQHNLGTMRNKSNMP